LFRDLRNNATHAEQQNVFQLESKNIRKVETKCYRPVACVKNDNSAGINTQKQEEEQVILN
jgi:hypothetical protein